MLTTVGHESRRSTAGRKKAAKIEDIYRCLYHHHRKPLIGRSLTKHSGALELQRTSVMKT